MTILIDETTGDITLSNVSTDATITFVMGFKTNFVETTSSRGAKNIADDKFNYYDNYLGFGNPTSISKTASTYFNFDPNGEFEYTNTNANHLTRGILVALKLYGSGNNVLSNGFGFSNVNDNGVYRQSLVYDYTGLTILPNNYTSSNAKKNITLEVDVRDAYMNSSVVYDASTYLTDTNYINNVTFNTTLKSWNSSGAEISSNAQLRVGGSTSLQFYIKYNTTYWAKSVSSSKYYRPVLMTYGDYTADGTKNNILNRNNPENYAVTPSAYQSSQTLYLCAVQQYYVYPKADIGGEFSVSHFNAGDINFNVTKVSGIFNDSVSSTATNDGAYNTNNHTEYVDYGSTITFEYSCNTEKYTVSKSSWNNGTGELLTTLTINKAQAGVNATKAGYGTNITTIPNISNGSRVNANMSFTVKTTLIYLAVPSLYNGLKERPMLYVYANSYIPGTLSNRNSYDIYDYLGYKSIYATTITSLNYITTIKADTRTIAAAGNKQITDYYAETIKIKNSENLLTNSANFVQYNSTSQNKDYRYVAQKTGSDLNGYTYKVSYGEYLFVVRQDENTGAAGSLTSISIYQESQKKLNQNNNQSLIIPNEVGEYAGVISGNEKLVSAYENGIFNNSTAENSFGLLTNAGVDKNLIFYFNYTPKVALSVYTDKDLSEFITLGLKNSQALNAFATYTKQSKNANGSYSTLNESAELYKTYKAIYTKSSGFTVLNKIKINGRVFEFTSNGTREYTVTLSNGHTGTVTIVDNTTSVSVEFVADIYNNTEDGYGQATNGVTVSFALREERKPFSNTEVYINGSINENYADILDVVWYEKDYGTVNQDNFLTNGTYGNIASYTSTNGYENGGETSRLNDGLVGYFAQIKVEYILKDVDNYVFGKNANTIVTSNSDVGNGAEANYSASLGYSSPKLTVSSNASITQNTTSFNSENVLTKVWLLSKYTVSFNRNVYFVTSTKIGERDNYPLNQLVESITISVNEPNSALNGNDSNVSINSIGSSMIVGFGQSITITIGKLKDEFILTDINIKNVDTGEISSFKQNINNTNGITYSYSNLSYNSEFIFVFKEREYNVTMQNNPATITGVTNTFITNYVSNYIEANEGTATPNIVTYETSGTTQLQGKIGAFGKLSMSTRYSSTRTDYTFNYFKITGKIGSSTNSSSYDSTIRATTLTPNVSNGLTTYSYEIASSSSRQYYGDVNIEVGYIALYKFTINEIDVTRYTDATKFANKWNSTTYPLLHEDFNKISATYSRVSGVASDEVVINGTTYYKAGVQIKVTVTLGKGYDVTTWKVGNKTITVSDKLSNTFTLGSGDFTNPNIEINISVSEITHRVDITKAYSGGSLAVISSTAITEIDNQLKNSSITSYATIGYYTNLTIQANSNTNYRIKSFVVSSIDKNTTYYNESVNATSKTWELGYYLENNETSNSLLFNNITVDNFYKTDYAINAEFQTTRTIKFETARLYNRTENTIVSGSVVVDSSAGLVSFNNDDLLQSNVTKTFDTNTYQYINIQELGYSSDGYIYKLEAIYGKNASGTYVKLNNVTFIAHASSVNTYTWGFDVTETMTYTEFYAVFVKQYRVNVNTLFENGETNGSLLNGYTISIKGESGQNRYITENNEFIVNQSNATGSITYTISTDSTTSMPSILSDFYYTENSNVAISVTNLSYNGSALKHILATKMVREGTQFNNNFATYANEYSGISRTIASHETKEINIYFDYYYIINALFVNKANNEILTEGDLTFTYRCDTAQSSTTASNYYENIAGKTLFRRGVEVSVIANVDSSKYAFKNWSTEIETDSVLPTGVTQNANVLNISSVEDSTLITYTFYAKLLKMLQVSVISDPNDANLVPTISVSTSDTFAGTQKSISVEEGTTVYLYANCASTAFMSNWQYNSNIIARATYPNQNFVIDSAFTSIYSKSGVNRIAFKVTETTTNAPTTSGEYVVTVQKLLKIDLTSITNSFVTNLSQELRNTLSSGNTVQVLYNGLDVFDTTRNDVVFVGNIPYVFQGTEITVKVITANGFGILATSVDGNTLNEGSTSGNTFTTSFVINADAKVNVEFKELEYVFNLYHSENKGVPSDNMTGIYRESVDETNLIDLSNKFIIGYFGEATVSTMTTNDSSRFDSWYIADYPEGELTEFPTATKVSATTSTVSGATFEILNGTGSASVTDTRRNFILIANYIAVYQVFTESYYRHNSAFTSGNQYVTVGGDELGFVSITNTATVGDNKYDVNTIIDISSKDTIDVNRNQLWTWYFKQEGTTQAKLLATYSYDADSGIGTFTIVDSFKTGEFENVNYQVTITGNVISLTFTLNSNTSGMYYAIYKEYFNVTISTHDLTDAPEGTGNYGSITATINTGYNTSLNESTYSVTGSTNISGSTDATISRWVEHNAVMTFTQLAETSRNYVFKYFNVSYQEDNIEFSSIQSILISSDITVQANFIQKFAIFFDAYPENSGIINVSNNGGLYEEGDIVEATVRSVDLNSYRFSRITKLRTEGSTIYYDNVSSGNGITISNQTISITVNKANSGTYVFQFISLYSITVSTIPSGIPSNFEASQLGQGLADGQSDDRLQGSQTNATTNKYRIANFLVESGNTSVNAYNVNTNDIIITANHALDYTFKGFLINNVLIHDYTQGFIRDENDAIIGNTFNGTTVQVNEYISIYYDEGVSRLVIKSSYMSGNLIIHASYTGEYHLFNIEGYGYVINYTDSGDVLKYYENRNEVLKGSSKSLNADLILGKYTDFKEVKIVHEGQDSEGNIISRKIVISAVDVNNGTSYTITTADGSEVTIRGTLNGENVKLTISDTEYILIVTAVFEMNMWTEANGVATATPLGDGTINNPYLISSAENLAWISRQLMYTEITEESNEDGTTYYVTHENNIQGLYFMQTADIDLTGYWWLPIGAIRSFSGIYNGNGYSITGLSVLSHDGLRYSDATFGRTRTEIIDGIETEVEDRFVITNLQDLDDTSIYTSADQLLPYVGLFAQASNAYIYNLNVTSGKNVEFNTDLVRDITKNDAILSKTYSTNQYVGGIVGSAYNTTIDNIKFYGIIDTYYMHQNMGNVYVGGIAGHTINGEIINCAIINTANGNAYSAPNTHYNSYGTIVFEQVEGFANVNEESNNGSANIGGLVGQINNTKISASTAKGRVYGTITSSSSIHFLVNIGGLVGSIDEYGTIVDSYANMDAKVNSTGRSSVSKIYFGGIVGYMKYYDVTIQRCYYTFTNTLSLQNANYISPVIGGHKQVVLYEGEEPVIPPDDKEEVTNSISLLAAGDIVSSGTYNISDVYYRKSSSLYRLDSNSIVVGVEKDNFIVSETNTFENFSFDSVWMNTANKSNVLSLKIADAFGYYDEVAVSQTSNTYMISTAEQLQWAVNNVTSGTIRLSQDIDLGGKFFKSGQLNAGVTLYGCGYTIKNLTLVNINGYNNSTINRLQNALISVNNGTIWHFNIAESISYNVVADVSTNTDYGMLVGLNNGTINKVIVSGNVVVKNLNEQTEINVGGVVGRTTKTLTINEAVNKAVFNGNIEVKDDTALSSTNIGGIVGKIDANSGLTNSYSTATISFVGNENGSIGGLVGSSLASTTIKDSYFEGLIDNSNIVYSVGAILGNAVGATSITNVYSIGTATVKYSALFRGLTGKSENNVTYLNSYISDQTIEIIEGYAVSNLIEDTYLHDQATFTNWDFVDTWYMDDYPKLVDTDNSHYITIKITGTGTGYVKPYKENGMANRTLTSEEENTFILLVPHGTTATLSVTYDELTTNPLYSVTYKNSGTKYENLTASVVDVENFTVSGEGVDGVYEPDTLTFEFLLSNYYYKVDVVPDTNLGFGYVGETGTKVEDYITHGNEVVLRAIEKGDAYNQLYTRFVSWKYNGEPFVTITSYTESGEVFFRNTEMTYTQYTDENGVTTTELRFIASSFNQCDLLNGAFYEAEFIRVFDVSVDFKIGENDEGITDDDLNSTYTVTPEFPQNEYNGRFNDNTKVTINVEYEAGYELDYIEYNGNVIETNEIYTHVYTDGDLPYTSELIFIVNINTFGEYIFHLKRTIFEIELTSFKGATITVSPPEGQTGGVYYLEPAPDETTGTMNPEDLVSGLPNIKLYGATYNKTIQFTILLDIRYNFGGIYLDDETTSQAVTSTNENGVITITYNLTNITADHKLLLYITQKLWTDLDYFENTNVVNYAFIPDSLVATSENNGLSYETAFILNTPGKLARLAYYINNNAKYTYDGGTYDFKNAYYIVRGGNINLYDRFWAPIKSFSGTIIVENGTTISNLTIDSSELNIDNQFNRFTELVEIDKAGMFENLSGATIYNLTLTNTNILSAANKNGIISAVASSSVLANISVDNTNYISATHLGGLIDTIYAGVIVYESYIDATINIQNYLSEFTLKVGGLIAESDGGSILNSYSNSNIIVNVESEVLLIAGLVAEMKNYATISNSFSNVTYENNLGTAVEKIANIIDSTSVISNTYYFAGTSTTGGAGLNIATITEESFVGFDFNNVWNFEGENKTPTIKSIKGTWDAQIETATISFVGSGTKEDPYLIQSNIDLVYLSKVINDNNATYNNSNVYFKIPSTVDEIDMGNYEFTPIGLTAEFKANFMGNYASISNLYINKPYLDNVGLFGIVTGSVENICVNANMVSGRTNVATGIAKIFGSESLQAQAFGIETSGRVIGNKNVGGAIGFADTNVYIKNLSNDYSNVTSYVSSNNTVFGTENVGGVVGYSNSNIYSSYNYNAYVYGGTNVGGVVGYSTQEIKDAYNNNGVVVTNIYFNENGDESYYNNVGGIVGYGKTITNVYSATTIYTYALNAGEIVGNGSNLVINASFYTNTMINNNDSASSSQGAGTTATSDAVLENRITLQNVQMFINAGWDFNNVWSQLIGTNDNMPILRYFYGIVVFVKVNEDTPFGQITPTPYDTTSPIRAEEGYREVYIMLGETRQFYILADRVANGYLKDYHISDISLDGVTFTDSSISYDNDSWNYEYSLKASNAKRERKELVISFAVDTFIITYNFIKTDYTIDNTIATTDGTSNIVPLGSEGKSFEYGEIVTLSFKTVYNTVGYRFDKFIYETQNISNQTGSINEAYTFTTDGEIYTITFEAVPNTAGNYFAMFVQQFYVDVTVRGDTEAHPDVLMGRLYHEISDTTNTEIPQFAKDDEFVSGWYDVGTTIYLRAVPVEERFEFVGWYQVKNGTETFVSEITPYTLTPENGLDSDLKYYAQFQIIVYDVYVTMNEDGNLNYSYLDSWNNENITGQLIEGPITNEIIFSACFGTELSVLFNANVESTKHYISSILVYNKETNELMADVISGNDYNKTVSISSLQNDVYIEVVFDPDLWTRGHYTIIPASQINGNTYTIKLNSELAYVAYLARTNPTFTTGKKFVIANDLNMIEYFWEPIGLESAISLDEFNGNNFAIDNIVIKRYYGSTYYNRDYSKDYIGLFGIVNGTIKNVKLTNVNYTGNYTTGGVGGIAGELAGGLVYECYVSGNINVTGLSVGGIVGINRGNVHSNDNISTITNTVTYVGGIVGVNYQNVRYSKNLGNIDVTGENVGGIVGINYNLIEQCVNEGLVTGSNYVGGIVGTMGRSTTTSKAIKDCYNTNSVVASNGNAGGIVGYIAFVEGDVAVYTSYNVGNVTGSSVGTIYARNDSKISISRCYTNVGNISGQATSLSESELTIETSFVGFNFNFPWTIRNDYNLGRPILVLAETRGYHTSSAIPSEQIEGSTYHIKTANELQYLAEMVRDNSNFAVGKTFVLDNDIDLFGHYILTIGLDVTTPFNGIFDGQNFEIKYVTVTSNNENVGLFGYANSDSEIKNFNVNNAYVYGSTTNSTYNLGVVVGQSLGKLENIKVLRGYLTDNIEASSTYTNKNIGGIVGLLSGTGVLLQNKSQIVVGNGNIGGVVGNLSGSLDQSSNHNISNSVLSVNTITCAGGNVGGVVGYANNNFEITNAYNTSNIYTSNQSGVYGGVVGYALNGSISFTYNVGSVIGATRYGSIVGTNSSTTLSYNYYLEGNNGIATSENGLTNNVEKEFEEKDELELRLPSTYETWDFGLIWAVVKDPTKPMYNNGYPVLIQMYDYNVIDIIVNNLEQGTIVDERHGKVTTEYGYVLGDKLYVINNEDTKLLVIPDDDSYIESITAEDATEIVYDRFNGYVVFVELNKDTVVYINFSQYLFDLIIHGDITASAGYVVDPSVKVVVFVQNIETRKTYMVTIENGQDETIYAVELGTYQIRVSCPMFHTAEIKMGNVIIANTFILSKTSHAEHGGDETIYVTLNKNVDQWINDSSQTW